MQCPFYRSDDRIRTVVCEGICDSCNVHLTFKGKKDLKIQMETFCEKYYEKCEIYRAAMMKYED